MSGRARARLAAAGVLAAIAVGLLAATAGGRSGFRLSGSGVTAVIKRTSIVIDSKHLLFGAAGWPTIDAAGGSATFVAPFATTTYHFPLPAEIPSGGVTVTFSLSVTPKAGQSYNAVMSVNGVLIQSGQKNSATGTVKIAGAGGVVVTIQDGPTIYYTYTAEPGGAQTTTTAPHETLLVFFNPLHDQHGISGNITLETVGAKDAQGGYEVKETNALSGSPEPLRVTRGLFGQHGLTLEIVSGYFEQLLPQTGSLILHVRVVASTDKACPVGSHGSVSAHLNHLGGGSTVISLCGQTVSIPTETSRLSVMPG